jgi:hypothetical protein
VSRLLLRIREDTDFLRMVKVASKAVRAADPGAIPGLPTFERFHKLHLDQQGAVRFGLGLEEKCWNDFVERKSIALQIAQSRKSKDHRSTDFVMVESAEAQRPTGERERARRQEPSGNMVPAEPKKKGVPRMLLEAAWRGAKKYVPAVGGLFKQAKGLEFKGKRADALELSGHAFASIPFWLDAYEGQIVVSGLGTVVYLDNSYSMKGVKLVEGQGALRKMSHLLQGSPVRVVKFGTHKQVIMPREEPAAMPQQTTSTEVQGVRKQRANPYYSEVLSNLQPEVINLQWDGCGGSTYMWHMILTDIQDKDEPNTGTGGKLRVIVITDGHDLCIPEPYMGHEGHGSDDAPAAHARP